MTIKELDEKLNSPGFQDPENGDLFYNYFIYQYPADKEYDIRKQIHDFKVDLSRPMNYLDVLVIDLFKEFCDFLDKTPFLKNPSLLQYLLKKEKDKPEKSDNVQSTLSRYAHSKDFLAFIHRRIMEHKAKKDEMRRPYVFLHGIGSMYPYLRVNEFLALYEDFNRTNEYKIIVFYPGNREENSYKLFHVLHDSNTYRATLLLNE